MRVVISDSKLLSESSDLKMTSVAVGLTRVLYVVYKPCRYFALSHKSSIFPEHTSSAVSNNPGVRRPELIACGKGELKIGSRTTLEVIGRERIRGSDLDMRMVGTVGGVI